MYQQRDRHPIWAIEEDQLAQTLRFVERHTTTPESMAVVILGTCRAGLIPAELVTLTTHDLFAPDGRLHERLIVGTGQPRHPLRRELAWHPQLKEAILRLYRTHPDAQHPAFRRTGDGKFRYHTAATLHQALNRTYLLAGLRGITAASGRQAFAQGLYEVAAEAGISMRDIQRLLGHTKIESTVAKVRAWSGAKNWSFDDGLAS